MKIDSSKMHDEILTTALELNRGVKSKDLRLYLEHKLDILLYVVENFSDMDLYDLFEEDVVDIITDIQMGVRNAD